MRSFLGHAQLDPKFETYVRDDPRISTLNRHCQLIRQFVQCQGVGRRKIEAIYRQQAALRYEGFFDGAFATTNIQPSFDLNKINNIPKQPLVFINNHPFGVVDGMALCQ